MNINWDKPVQTVVGGKVRILCKDRKYRHPVVALVQNPSEKEEELVLYDINGEPNCFYSLLNYKLINIVGG